MAGREMPLWAAQKPQQIHASNSLGICDLDKCWQAVRFTFTGRAAHDVTARTPLVRNYKPDFGPTHGPFLRISMQAKDRIQYNADQ